MAEKKMSYCIGGGITKDLPEFNFISICSEKKLNNAVNCIIFFLTIFKFLHRINKTWWTGISTSCCLIICYYLLITYLTSSGSVYF